MQIEDQTETAAFLAGCLPGIRVIETHISVLFLGADTVFKLKKAVRLPYVDLSTVDRRLACCRRELELNRRTAPALYRSVRRITRDAVGRLVLDGEGETVDAVVEMARFDDAGLADRLAEEGWLSPPLVEAMAAAVAAFHAEAAPVADGGGPGGAARIAAVLDINRRALEPARGLFGEGPVEGLVAASARLLDRHADLADLRQRQGWVRRCHGDLHLRNIVFIDGAPVLFDCLEFDEDMATTDVLYDVAFLVMDLIHRGLSGEANVVFNRYLDLARADDGVPLMPLFLAMRATVRGHIAATVAAEARAGDAVRPRADAAAYLDLAAAFLVERPAVLVAIGGLSGSGKSTVARGLAPHVGAAPGARELSSDRTRKRLFGVPAVTKLPPEAYRPGVSRTVYSRLFKEAATVARAGHSVVVNAVFDRAEDRDAVEAAAHAAGVPFLGLWLDAPEAVLIDRVEHRSGDPSDADATVVRAQATHSTGEIKWTRIDASMDAASVVAAARQACAARFGDPSAVAARFRA
ncbi:hypothetical protein SAMN02745172_00093 [Pseudoxanthobacter soli DSM 19599]|uniref:Aminoglycoside phosphotransferase domain-containing protein n=1 Tax=Pseudoxanthobacter soli DSM 19599 TaxID=1123029 RepID=A0A1M7Z4J2_9HYPH|nr:bifunctional aminoglycoside phosphotransferase/ATP-binding protein [Pseudoxanthobacter soli]SHO59867.1 hypothetical protein SAMN02745172_00093 [Pseudoxanthobacter soli DSM 19599]